MKKLRFLPLILVIFVIISPSIAATLKSGDTTLISIPVADDAYIAGGKVVVSEQVNGDAVISGGSLLVNGEVVQDLTIAGGSIVINGPVGDDLRAAGGDITISESVEDDLIIAGGSITIDSGVTVGGDVIAAGGQIILAGTVEGNVKAAGGEIIFTGTVQGNSDMRAVKNLEQNGDIQGKAVFSAPTVIIGQDMKFGGDVEYWQKEGEIDFTTIPVGGTVVFNNDLRLDDKFDFSRRGAAGLFGAWFLYSILSGALIILIFTLAFGGWINVVTGKLRNTFWPNCGRGFLYFAAAPFIGILLCITIIGAPVGIFLLFMYIVSIYIAILFTSVVLAKWIEIKRKTEWRNSTFFLVSLGLFILLKLLMFVPILGWFTVIILACAAFGALLSTKWEFLQYGNTYKSREY